MVPTDGVAQFTRWAPPLNTLVSVALFPAHIAKLAPTEIALKLFMTTVKSLIVIFPQGLVAVKRITLGPSTAPGPGTLTVIELAP